MFMPVQGGPKGSWWIQSGCLAPHLRCNVAGPRPRGALSRLQGRPASGNAGAMDHTLPADEAARALTRAMLARAMLARAMLARAMLARAMLARAMLA